MRIVVVNIKGGVGKTTTAMNLAAIAAADGNSVLLLDADMDQVGGTSRVWYEAIPDEKEWTTYGLDAVPEGLDLKAFDHIIIDAPPGHQERIARCIDLADAAIIPVSPKLGEVHAVHDAVQRAKNRVATKVLICRVDRRRSAANDELLQDLKAHGIAYFRKQIPLRAEIEDGYMRHPRSCFTGWVHYSDVWRELVGTEDELV